MHIPRQTEAYAPPPLAVGTRTIQFAYDPEGDETLIFGRRPGEPDAVEPGNWQDAHVTIACADGTGLIMHMADTFEGTTSLGIAPLSDTTPLPLGPGGWQVRYDLPCPDAPDSPLVLTVIAPATARITAEDEG